MVRVSKRKLFSLSYNTRTKRYFSSLTADLINSTWRWFFVLSKWYHMWQKMWQKMWRFHRAGSREEYKQVIFRLSTVAPFVAFYLRLWFLAPSSVAAGKNRYLFPLQHHQTFSSVPSPVPDKSWQCLERGASGEQRDLYRRAKWRREKSRQTPGYFWGPH